MKNTIVKKIISLSPGDKFWFNNGMRGELWVLSKIVKDERFPTPEDPYDVWEITYHLDINNPNTHLLHVDYRDTAVIPI